MAGTPIAEGVVIVSADAKDVPRDVARDIDDGESRVRESGNRTGRALFAGLAKWAVGTVATVGSAVGGLALYGGFDRALNIQEAQKKLEGLGHSTESISSIMNSALNSVRGTAFGLGAAATTSAGLVAAGVSLGDELERRLKTVADTATIAGRSMEDVGLIFQSVAAKGKLQGDDLLQLMSAGVPVLQFLANHLGKTSEEISDMVSKGEIDFATFADAMEENLGGAALRSGETARGSLANVFAALSRLGEGFAGPAVTLAPQLFGSIARAIDQVDAALAPVQTAFTEWLTPAVQTFSSWLDGINWTKVIEGAASFSPLTNALRILEPLLPTVQRLGDQLLPVLGDTLREVGDAIAPVLPMIGEALVDAVVRLAPPLTDVLVALLPLLPPLTELAVSVIPPLVEFLNFLVDGMLNTGRATEWIYEVFGYFFDLLSGNDGAMSPFMDALATAPGILGPVGEAVINVGQFFTDAFTNIGNAFTWLDQNIVQPFVTTFWTAFGVIAGIVTWLWSSAVQPVINAISDGFTWIGNTIIAPTAAFISAVMTNLGTIFTWLYQGAIKPAFDAVASVFQWVYGTIIAPIAGFIGKVMTGAGDTSKRAFSGLGDFIGQAFQNALNAIKGPVNGIISLVNRAIRGINGLSVTIPDWVPEVGGQTWGVNIPTIPMLAKGGVIRSGGTVMVGERGPEFLNLPTGAQVTPLNRPDALPSTGGNAPFIGGDLIINEATDPLGSAGRFAAEARKYRRTR